MKRIKEVTNKELIGKVLTDTIPVMTGYLALGAGYGILMDKSGFSFLFTVAMSLFVYAGSMQYFAISLLTGGASLVSVALSTLLVNARHLFYGISMVDKYRDSGKKKPYLIFSLTDETYSLVSRNQALRGLKNVPQEEFSTYAFMVSLLDQIYWVAGTVIGLLLGGLITFNTAGIDFALTALFISICTEQFMSAEGMKDRIPMGIGFVASIVCLVLIGKDAFMIPAMVIILLALIAMERKCYHE